MSKISFNGITKVLKEYSLSGEYEKCFDWSIASGGYDLQWEIYYCGYTVLQCINGELIGGFRPFKEFDLEVEEKLIKTIKRIYTDIK